MENDNRKYRVGFIDYIWYVAERFSKREHNNLSGGMLLFLCWLAVIALPSALLTGRFFGWLGALAVGLILCFIPGLFCKLRYTAGRREALRDHYRGMKRPVRRLIRIILIAFALTMVDFVLMFHFGFLHWNK